MEIPSSSIISRNTASSRSLRSLPESDQAVRNKTPGRCRLHVRGSFLPAHRCRYPTSRSFCCRACRSKPIIRISASFDPSSVRFGRCIVYSARRGADFVMSSVIWKARVSAGFVAARALVSNWNVKQSGSRIGLRCRHAASSQRRTEKVLFLRKHSTDGAVANRFPQPEGIHM